MIKSIIRILYIVIAFNFLLTTTFAHEPEYYEATSAQEVQDVSNRQKEDRIDTGSFFEESEYADNEDEIAIPSLFEKKQTKVIEENTAAQEKTEITLDSDKVFYNDETNEVEVLGNVRITTKPEKSKLTASL